MHDPSNAAVGIAAMGGFLFLSLILIGIAFTVLWIYTLTDILKSEFNGNTKIIWFLLIFFLPPLGVILYFLIGRDQKLTEPNPDETTRPTTSGIPKTPTKSEPQKKPSALTIKN